MRLTPKQARKLQIEIYKKMSAEKKLKIAGQLYSLGKKLQKLKKRRHDSRETFM